MEPEFKPRQLDSGVCYVAQPCSCSLGSPSLARKEAKPDYLRDLQKANA